ncbi:MAG: ester cyclase [Actinomycetota bacterium]|nr:ester cyclase [Actinomycetota bacterium]
MKELGERWFDTVRGGDVDAIAAMLTDDVDFYTPAGSVRGPQEAAALLHGFAVAMPDAGFNIRQWIEEGNSAAAEGSYTGTHTGPLAGPMGEVPATGRSVDVPFTTVFEVRDGKISAHRAYWDNATFMMQLGLMPPPGGGA